MVKVLTSLELYVVVQELKGLQGARVQKIYQPDSHTLVLHFYKKGGNSYVFKIDSGVGIHLTSYNIQYPQAPPTFCMFLRKYLNNSELVSVVQKDLERVIEISFQTREGKLILICELFSKGNFILTNSNYNILNAASVQIWKHRKIKKDEKYVYPPKSGINLFRIGSNLSSYLNANDSNPVVNFLATIGFGSLYAEEICARADVKKDKQISMLSKDDEKMVVKETSNLLAKIESMEISPTIYYKDSKPVEATPTEMNLLSSFEKKEVATFNEALDVLYMTERSLDIKSKKESELQQEKDRINKIVETQEKSLQEYRETYEKNKRQGDLIYENYREISKVVRILKEARKSGQSWYDIYTVVEGEKEEGISEAEMIKKLYPEDETVLLDIENGLKIDLRKSLEENAECCYDKAKKAKAKIDGAKKTLERSRQGIEKIESDKEEAYAEIESKTPKPKEIKKKEWYEKFRWFFTSSGLLAIGGKDATQNEILIKRYLEIQDLVFHTELPGSPFFILKKGRDDSGEQDMQEVAIATASYSRAWKIGTAVADVFCVRAEQVTKEAPGAYLPKGSFMVTGKRKYFRNAELKVAVGITKHDKIIGGPAEAIRKYGVKMIELKQGPESKTNTAKKIAHKLNASVDDVISFLPSGEFQIC